MTAAVVEENTNRWWVQLILIPLSFYLGAKLSLAFAVMPEVLVLLWIPNSLLLATLFHYHSRRYLYFVALIIVAEIAADYPTFSLIEAILFGAVNVLEVTIAYLLLRRWRFDPRFATPNDIAKFIIAGPLVATCISASGGALIYHFGRGLETSFLEFMRVWWFSDGLGLLLLTPLVLSLWPPVPGVLVERLRFRWYDGLAVVLSLGAMVVFALSQKQTFLGLTVRSFILIPPVLYAAARFSNRIATTVVVVVSGLLLFAIKNNQQPFGDLPIRETMISAQEVIFVLSTMSLGLTALMSQHRANTRELEARVQERTAELSAANQQLEQLAVSDALTGLLNRRALLNVVQREMAREKRYAHGLALIIFDIDHFKKINDCYGHLVGDTVLKHVAALSHSVVRNTDKVARFGGEEFVVVASEIDQCGALKLAEHLHTALRSTDIAINHEVLRITASFGVAMMDLDDEKPEQIIQRADEALYAAKAGGRDQIIAL